MRRLLTAGPALALLLAGCAPGGERPPSFASQVAPPAPDYAAASAWAGRPEAPGATAHVPGGAFASAGKKDVDVFYVHPTTFRSGSQWNQDISHPETNAWTDISVVARQATIFNECCRIFAPRYRQAATMAHAAMEGEGMDAYALAYQDVLRAFDYYLAKDNGGRPFILAGHSQGALHVRRLLIERIEERELADRLVAAYAVGIGIAEGEFAREFRTVQPCNRPDDVRCLLSWNARAAGSDVSEFLERNRRLYRSRYGSDGEAGLLCINPITFDRSRPSASRSDHVGALPGAALAGPLPALRPGSVAARCNEGVLMVDLDPALAMETLPGGNLHYHDLSLFYGDVRQDAARRIAAYRQKEASR